MSPTTSRTRHRTFLGRHLPVGMNYILPIAGDASIGTGCEIAVSMMRMVSNLGLGRYPIIVSELNGNVFPDLLDHIDQHSF